MTYLTAIQYCSDVTPHLMGHERLSDAEDYARDRSTSSSAIVTVTVYDFYGIHALELFTYRNGEKLPDDFWRYPRCASSPATDTDGELFLSKDQQLTDDLDDEILF